jgi:hypothetical protein
MLEDVEEEQESLASYIRKLESTNFFMYSWADAKEFPKTSPMDVPGEVMDQYIKF